MAYQGLDDRACQEQLARLYLEVCPSLAWVAPHCRPGASRRPGKKIRLGIISRFQGNHTVAKLMRGLIARLDRERFEVVVIQLGKADPHDRLNEAAQGRIMWLGGGLEALREQIAAAELDILFYSAIGMDPKSYFLAFARLAPVQCVTWGHPVTTGIPTVDAYLSTDSFEPDGAEAHYSEQLVRLGRLPSWYERPIVPTHPVDRAALGLPEDATLYACPQSLFKLHPDFDDAVAEILRRDPRGKLVLIDGQARAWGEIVKARLSALMPDVDDRVLFLPRMSGDRFFDLVRASDVLLDPFHFGSGNTMYEAFAVGKPIVTMPGAFMRSRVVQGAYRQMGIAGPIAASRDEYVRLAVELANDRGARDRLGDQIHAASGELFEDDRTVAEYEAYFERAVAGMGTKGSAPTLNRL
jgi:predicted O-linked N-acetylglucosamine transferase (SPINDLY family)